MIYHDVIQNTPEWFDLRLGKATTSNFSKVMANYGKAFGEPAKSYAVRIALEQVKGVYVEEHYTNDWMDRGHVLEPVAREKYERENFADVSNGGFCQHEDIKDVGGSPDGLILYDKGGIEIKSVKYNTHYKNIKRNSFDPAYKWQILGNIWLCDLDYMDFISYCPEYTKEKELYVHRVERSDYQDEIDMIEPRLIEFMDLVKEIRRTL